MKLAAFSIAYNEEQLIRGCINTWKPFVEKHVVLVSAKPFYGEPEKADNTVKIAKEMGARVFVGDWREEHKMRNAAVSMLRDYDYILVNDADMWMTPQGVQEMLNEIEKDKGDAYVIPQKAYWYDIEHCLVNDDFKPVIAMRPSVRFTHIGCVNTSCRVVQSAFCHHLNWCKPKNILKKVLTYAHAPEFKDAKGWYENHFVGWQEGNPAIMPDGKFFDVAKDPLPEELKSWL